MRAKIHLLKTIFKKGHIPHNKGGSSWWVKGELNPNWNGGSTAKNALIRRSPEVKIWRMRVLVRDSFTCVLCGAPDSLIADHIKSFALYPDLRTELSNGRTLCRDCHMGTTSYLGSRRNAV